MEHVIGLSSSNFVTGSMAKFPPLGTSFTQWKSDAEMKPAKSWSSLFTSSSLVKLQFYEPVISVNGQKNDQTRKPVIEQISKTQARKDQGKQPPTKEGPCLGTLVLAQGHPA